MFKESHSLSLTSFYLGITSSLLLILGILTQNIRESFLFFLLVPLFSGVSVIIADVSQEREIHSSLAGIGKLVGFLTFLTYLIYAGMFTVNDWPLFWRPI